MSSFDGREEAPSSRPVSIGPAAGVGVMLFDSLVHQLIEKGLLTKNDALSIVQTVAQVTRGQLEEDAAVSATSAEVALLRRLYDSFEALRDRSVPVRANFDNVLQLRPPLHGDAPEFPLDD